MVTTGGLFTVFVAEYDNGKFFNVNSAGGIYFDDFPPSGNGWVLL